MLTVIARRAVLTYMYTRTVSDADLRLHAVELMEAANQYHLMHLHEKCEKYLCWGVMVCCYDFPMLCFFLTSLLHRRAS